MDHGSATASPGASERRLGQREQIPGRRDQPDPPERGLVRALRDDLGGAIIVAILVSMVILAMAAVALNMSRSEMRVSATHDRSAMVH